MSEEASSLKVSLLQMDETLLGRALKKCNDMLTGESLCLSVREVGREYSLVCRRPYGIEHCEIVMRRMWAGA